MWGQEANPVANKSEYIREGHALRKSLKGLKYKKQKKKNWMFCKVNKENQRSLKMYNFNCLCKLWIWFTTRVLNRVSFWAVNVDEEQSIVTLLVTPFFPQVFSMCLSLEGNWIMYTKWNESDYKIKSLGLKRVGKCTMCPTTHTLFHCKPREVISHSNILLPLVVTAKSVKFYGL